MTIKLSGLGADLLTDTLPRWLRGEIVPVAQDEARATYAPRLAKEAGEIDWQQPAEQIERQVRAYQPWPSAYTTWRGQRLKVIRARAVAEVPEGDAAVGAVVGGGDSAGVITGQGTLWLEEVQLAGKRMLEIQVFLRGAPGFNGAHLPS
jgi:methionyl-tRNA formyltransferase